MGPRKVHKLRVGKYTFMREFLNKEWSVVDDERGNVDTIDNASIDAVWDSFQSFLEMNGYSQDFCSKILFGKLLHEAGVEKVKRGPRKKQKFYYFPLKPVSGSRAESIVATSIDARFNTRAFFSNLNKIKPEYYTLRSSSLGRVSVGILYDRSMTPEKFTARALKKKLSAKQNTRKSTKNGVAVVQPQIQTKVEQLTTSDVNESSNPPFESSIQTSEIKAPVPDIRKQPALDVKCSAPEVAENLDPEAVTSEASNRESTGKNTSLVRSETNVGDDLSEILAQSIAGIQEAENVNEVHSTTDMYLSNWQDGFNQALKAPQSSHYSQPSLAAGFNLSVPSTSACLDPLARPGTLLPGQDEQTRTAQQWQNNVTHCACDSVSGQIPAWQSNETANFPFNFPPDWQPSSQSNLRSDWHHVGQSSYSVDWLSNSCVLGWPSQSQANFEKDWSISGLNNDAPVGYQPDWNPTGPSAQVLQSTPNHYYHDAKDWVASGEAALTPYDASHCPTPYAFCSQSTSVPDGLQHNGSIQPIKVAKRPLGRPKGSKTNPNKLRAKKEQRVQDQLVSQLEPTNEVPDSAKRKEAIGKRPLSDEKKINANAGRGTKKRSSKNTDDFSLLNLDAGTRVREIPWKLTDDVRKRQVDPITGKRPRGRPKGSKNKKSSKKALLLNPSGITLNEMKPHSTALAFNKPLSVCGFRSFVTTDFKNWSKRGRKPKRALKLESDEKELENNKVNDPPLSYSLGPNYELKHNKDLFGVYAAEPFPTLPFSVHPNTSQSSYGVGFGSATGETVTAQFNAATENNPTCASACGDGLAPSLVACLLPTDDVYALADWNPFPELQ